MELEEITAFLARQVPFDRLGAAEIGALARKVEIRYFPRESMVIEAGVQNRALGIVRAGAVELRLGGTQLSHRLGEGGLFGYPSLLHHALTRNQVVALEDSLIYQIPRADFLALHAAHPDLQAFFVSDEAERLREAVKGLQAREDSKGGAGLSGGGLAAIEVGSILRRSDVVTIEQQHSIAQAASLMTREDVSTLPVTGAGRLVGILTDKDLRRRVLGVGLSPERPVADIMTADPVTLKISDDLLAAMLTMTRYNIHHLPVVSADGALAGVISASDIINQFGMNAVQTVARIRAAPDAAAVAAATASLDTVLAHLVETGVDASHASRFISTIGEAAHQQLLKLAQAQLGPPPVPFALVVFGSLARQEQAGGSDQDNGFILDDRYDPALHGDYFAQLAGLLCDGLNSAGYVYCPGDIMATNSQWRQPLKVWMERYQRWIDKPDPQNILNTTIFFDMRGIAGETALVDQLRSHIYSRGKANRIFLSFVARAAASTRVPLGFFRNFLLEHDEGQGDVLDLKHQAIAPVVDIARVHALAHGLGEVNSEERLAAACKAGGLSEAALADLLDCFAFIRAARLHHQARQIRQGHKPDSKISPEALSRFEREHLKDAFAVIRSNLEALSRTYAGNIR